MLNRRETLIVSLTVGLLALVGAPLLWVLVVMSRAIDLRIEAPFNAGQWQIAIIFTGWLLAGTVIALAGAWAAHKAGKGEAAASEPASAQEVVVPRAKGSVAERAAQEPRPAVGAVTRRAAS